LTSVVFYFFGYFSPPGFRLNPDPDPQEFLYMEKDEQCSGACRKELAGIEALEKSKDQEDKAKLNKLFT
jgi:hypothetical protein